MLAVLTQTTNQQRSRRSQVLGRRVYSGKDFWNTGTFYARSAVVVLAVWHSGSIVCRMNEVTLRQVRLVLGWVTIFRQVYHLDM